MKGKSGCVFLSQSLLSESLPRIESFSHRQQLPSLNYEIHIRIDSIILLYCRHGLLVDVSEEEEEEVTHCLLSLSGDSSTQSVVNPMSERMLYGA